MVLDSPVAVPTMSLTCTVISVDDGLLRTSTGCVGPSSSSTLYVDCSNCTVIAKSRIRWYCNSECYICCILFVALLSSVYSVNHLRSSSTIVTIAWPPLTLSGVEDGLIVRVMFSSSSNISSSFIEKLKDTLVTPAGNIMVDVPEE